MRSLFVLCIALVGSIDAVCADSDPLLSPAISPFPTMELKQFRTCVSGEGRRSGSDRAVEQVTGWFREFGRPVFASASQDVRHPASTSESGVYARIRATELLARRLTKHETGHALIALVDAAIRSNGPMLGCTEVRTALIVRIVEQRDRASVWANRLERRLFVLDRWHRARNTLDRLQYSADLADRTRRGLDAFKD